MAPSPPLRAEPTPSLRGAKVTDRPLIIDVSEFGDGLQGGTDVRIGGVRWQ